MSDSFYLSEQAIFTAFYLALCCHVDMVAHLVNLSFEIAANAQYYTLLHKKIKARSRLPLPSLRNPASGPQ